MDGIHPVDVIKTDVMRMEVLPASQDAGAEVFMPILGEDLYFIHLDLMPIRFRDILQGIFRRKHDVVP